MLGNHDHERLIERFYASALGDVAWSATLAEVADVFRLNAAVLRVADSKWKTLAAENSRFQADFAMDYYSGEVYANDPRRVYLEASPPGSVYFDHKLYDVEEMSRHPGYREAVSMLQVKYQMGAVLRIPNGGTAALALLSTEAEGHASEEAIRAFRRLVPIVEQACALGHVVESGAATQAALLEALSCGADGVILLSRAGTPTFMNDVARTIMTAGDGLSCTPGGLVARRPPETRRLQQLIHAALAGPGTSAASPGGRLLISRPSGNRPYVVSVMATPPTERFLAKQSIACGIHIHDLAIVRLPDRVSLSSVFGLTDREIDLATELVRRVSLSAAAAATGMALNTARNHLQNIFRKTQVSTQAELTQILGRLP